MPLQIRRGTDAERVAMTQPLASGELLYVTDQQRLYVGDSSTIGGVPVTGFNAEDAVDAVGAALVAGTHENIAFTYGPTQDNAGRIDASVSISTLLENMSLNGFDINGIGNITLDGQIQANSFKGSVFADGSTLLVDGVDGTFNLNGTVKSDIIPSADSAFDLGSSSYKFKDLWLSGSSIHLGNAVITSSSTVVNLPAGSTVNGNLISTGFDGNSITANLNGSVFGDDSTVLVDGLTSLIVGDVANDITASRRLNLTSSITTDVGILIDTNASGNDNVDLFNINTYHSETEAIGAFFTRSRGTIANPTTIQNGDPIFSIGFAGRTSDLALSPVAFMTASVDGAVSNGVVPGKFEISTTNASGTLVSALSIDKSQVITVASNTVTAGVGSGQADIGSVATYLKIIIGTTEYAIPAYAINP